MTQIDTLLRVGFRKAGCWVLQEAKPCYSLQDAGSERDVLYAFVADGQVLYIGKTTRGLKKRMYGYQRPGPTQNTNIACNDKLLELLGADRSVDIYVFVEPEPTFHAGIRVNLAAGLEDNLIAEVKPLWNRTGL